jgi:hypothetical protein
LSDFLPVGELSVGKKSDRHNTGSALSRANES